MLSSKFFSIQENLSMSKKRGKYLQWVYDTSLPIPESTIRSRLKRQLEVSSFLYLLKNIYRFIKKKIINLGTYRS